MPRSDTPFHGTPPFTNPDKPYGRIIWSSKLALGKPAQPRPAICGNYNNGPSESMGSLMSGELQTTSRTILSVSEIFNYQECAVLCGMDDECRAAEFNSDLLTCTVIGEYTSTGSVANSQCDSGNDNHDADDNDDLDNGNEEDEDVRDDDGDEEDEVDEEDDGEVEEDAEDDNNDNNYN
ncbi:hypothetical protein ElyMa_002192100 [Elysia marginata]|uniref:Apple domain-containing protein n=1 Tax=Elysia marginata TaxID=1093978 RepID=A0AAV4FQ98_9GAST|nr:hypothetical protein ElyMa_002192100 [Elysia marginata]